MHSTKVESQEVQEFLVLFLELVTTDRNLILDCIKLNTQHITV